MYETQILKERYYWVFRDSDSQFACVEKEAILFWGYLEDAILLFSCRPREGCCQDIRIPKQTNFEDFQEAPGLNHYA